jgi:phosphate starvation-inducible PhoH-like protein
MSGRASRNTRRESSRFERRKRGGQQEQTAVDVMDYEPVVERKTVAPLKALTEAQGQYIAEILSKTITFGVGPAGTGKSFVAISIACEKLLNKEIDKIILTRPMVETGAKVGALPGELSEKYAPFIEPVIQIFYERLGKSQTEYFLKRKRIEAKPLEFLRGSTFNSCVAILDESENVTRAQMKMFLTRIGENCKVIVNGDIEQSDIHGLSGLEDAVNRLRGVKGIGIAEFSEDDIVRSEIIKSVIKAYRK